MQVGQQTTATGSAMEFAAASNYSSPTKTGWNDRPCIDADTDFLGLLSAYRQTGGLARWEEIVARNRSADFLQLARSITAGGVISFVWQETIWLPCFQFEPGSQTVRPDVQILIDELSGALDGSEMAHWFVDANPCLNGEIPIQHMAARFEAVHDAARALRYLHCN